MKKILLLALLSATTFFTSCSNDDNSDSTLTQKELLIGTWKIKESGYIKDNKDIAEPFYRCEDQNFVTFNKDKSYVSTIFEYVSSNCVRSDDQGKWSLENSTNLTVNLNDNDDIEKAIVKVLTKTDLRIESTSEDTGEVVEYYVYSRVN